jgi:hypothetical protein
MDNARHETRTLVTKKREQHTKDHISELETNSTSKNITDLYRGINSLHTGYRSRIHLVKDENGDLLVNSHNICNRWKNHFCQRKELRWD